MSLRSLLFLLALVASTARAIPQDHAETYASLAELVDSAEVSAVDMLKGSYDAARFYSAGAPGVPFARSRFGAASSFGQASVAGLYLTQWGKADDIAAIRAELERSRPKRAMLMPMVGNEERFFAAVAQGASYQPLLRQLPSLGGIRALAAQCLASPDPLVRRAGLFWGYWVADAGYWGAVKALALGEADGATRAIARRLLIERAPSP